MAEKRFEMNVGVLNFTDKQTKRMYSEYNLEEIVSLLNEQNETIEELQSELRFAKIEKEKLQDNIHITELDLQYYKSKCASLEEGLFRQDREISRLEKEKKTLADALTVYFQSKNKGS